MNEPNKGNVTDDKEVEQTWEPLITYIIGFAVLVLSGWCLYSFLLML